MCADVIGLFHVVTFVIIAHHLLRCSRVSLRRDAVCSAAVQRVTVDAIASYSSVVRITENYCFMLLIRFRSIHFCRHSCLRLTLASSGMPMPVPFHTLSKF